MIYSRFVLPFLLFRLVLPQLHINNVPLQCVDSVKNQEYTFDSAHDEDEDILRQMRTLYGHSNRIVRVFLDCSTKVMIEFLCGSVYCSYLWTHYKCCLH